MKACRVALLLALLLSLPALAAFPEKQIRFIVPSPPGSPPDVMARLVGERLAAAFGQPVIVDNRPGASGTLGLAILASATPDGHTVAMMALPYTVAPALISRVPYNTERDLAGVAQLAWSSNMLVVRTNGPWQTLQELVRAAKSQPGRLSAASGGNATPAHLALELFKRHAALDIQHVPFKGTVPGITAVIGGQVDLMFATTGVVSSHIKSGQLRGLATVAPTRAAAHPDVPTMRELGYGAFDYRDWMGIVAPAATPRSVVTRLAKETAKVLANPIFAERLIAAQYEPTPDSGPEAFHALILSELARWSKVIRETGIRAD